MVAASALLSAGLVAGLAGADAAAVPAKGWVDPPARPASAARVAVATAEIAKSESAKSEGAKSEGAKVEGGKPVASKSETVETKPACRPAAVAQPAGCSAQGRAVRVIALTKR
ncbi:hypothetical protein [Methylobacterium sp. Leaf118]|uniref:hypothetical protein n=1 Tax=Methylobacterium sp. Leaf118 TaxID=2876562 RepID=UPI001E3C63B2|nr:hypothetical protein [Methylobacterium sp. Leaf118]